MPSTITKKGVARPKHITVNKRADTLTDTHPLVSTAKQKEVIGWVSKKKNISEIARILKIGRNAVRDRLKACKTKGLLKQENTIWLVTKKGEQALLSKTVGMSGSNVYSQKSLHKNEFTVNISSFPNNWSNSTGFFSCLRAKDYFHNKTANQWFIYYEGCTVRISLSVSKVTFFIKECVGSSFESLQSEVWDNFVQYFNLLENKGFKFERTVSSVDPHFADPQGFFSKLAEYKNVKGFRISLKDGFSFWVDYSLDIPEEETDNNNYAEYLENLAESSNRTRLTFDDVKQNKDVIFSHSVDLNLLVKVTNNLVVLQSRQLVPEFELVKGGLFYVG